MNLISRSLFIDFIFGTREQRTVRGTNYLNIILTQNNSIKAMLSSTSQGHFDPSLDYEHDQVHSAYF